MNDSFFNASYKKSKPNKNAKSGRFWVTRNLFHSDDQTFNLTMTILPDMVCYRIMRGFHRAFLTSKKCIQGKLSTTSITWSHPMLDLHMLYLLWPISSQACHDFSDFALRTSQGSFSILLSIRNRRVIEVFGGVLCCHDAFFFCGCRGFCHITDSDLFLFLFQENHDITFHCCFEKKKLICVKFITKTNLYEYFIARYCT